MSRSASFALTALLVLLVGCVDTAEPTGPVPVPDPEDPGELAPTVLAASAASDPVAAEATASSRRTPAR